MLKASKICEPRPYMFDFSHVRMTGSAAASAFFSTYRLRIPRQEPSHQLEVSHS